MTETLGREWGLSMSYCANCGQVAEAEHVCAGHSPARSRGPVMPAVPAGPGVRAGGYLVDLIPLLLAGLMLGWIPIAGPMLYALFAIPYWLLKDVTGSSLGKKLVGTRVVSLSGGEATTGARVARNLPLAVPAFFLLIPLIGPPVAMTLGGVTTLVEVVALLSRQRRTGDMLAGTIVIRV